MTETDGLIAALPWPVLRVAATGRITAANAAADGLFGLDLAGRHHVAALRQPDLLDALGRVLAGAGAVQVRHLVRDGARDQIWRVTVAPLPAGGALAAFEDETPVEAAGRMRRDFVANVSHELKTPLTALLGFIETLRTTARDDPAARERFLAIMEREAQRMNRLVADLLSLSRVEEDERMRPRMEVDLAAMVRRTLATLRVVVEQAGVTVLTRLPEAPITVPGDADQIQQVVANLVENAIKYGKPRGTVTISLAPPVLAPSLGVPAAALSVADDGPGIDAVHIPRLTERFYRVDAHRSRAGGGTGLGLAIVKHIVGRHRGRLVIDSQPGEGSRFTALLPSGEPPSLS